MLRPLPRALLIAALAVAALTATACRPLPESTPAIMKQPRSEVATVPMTTELLSRVGTATPAAVVTTSTGDYDMTFAVMGSTTASVGETIAVVLWVSTDATESRSYSGGQNRWVSNVFVSDSDGNDVLDLSGLRRGSHGPPASGIIDVGSPIVVPAFFKMDRPGRYQVFDKVSFSVAAAGPDDRYRAVTPSITVLVK